MTSSKVEATPVLQARNRWLVLGRKLTDPHPAVTAPEARRRARLLSALILGLVPVGLASSVGIPLLTMGGTNPFQDPVTLFGLAGTLLGVVAYAISRTRHHLWAASFTVALALMATWGGVLSGAGTPHQAHSPYFLGLAVLVASILLPMRATLVLSLVNLLALSALPLAGGAYSSFDISGPFVFLFFHTVFIGVAAFVRHRDLGQIEAQNVRLGEGEARYRHLFHSTHEGILIVAGGRVQDVNLAASELLSRPREALLGQEARNVLPGVPEAWFSGHQEAGPIEVAFEAPGRSPRPLELLQKDSHVGGHAARLVAVRDLTLRHRAEEDRRVAYRRAHEIERLREINQFKTTLLNTASHELNTPLTALRLQLHLLETSTRMGDRERQQRAMTLLNRNVERLSGLVTDILDVARMQGGRLALRPRPVELAELLRDSVEAFEAMAMERGLSLTAQARGPVWLDADPQRLTQVVYNLLSNALKFTPMGGHVHASIESEANHVLLTVRDTGMGIRPEDQTRLFQPFTQVHDTMELTEPGSGLGLYISRGIVEEHGGAILVDSSGPGLGTTFTVRLPLRGARGLAAPLAAAASTNP